MMYGTKWMEAEILEKLDDGVFVRTLQCLAAAQKNQQTSHGKEPSLMPVPSPQQISYLNQFEGTDTPDFQAGITLVITRQNPTTRL